MIAAWLRGPQDPAEWDQDLWWMRSRLIAVARRLQQLESQPHQFARKHQMEALRLAADDLILAAARQIGVTAAKRRGPIAPLQREQLTAALRQHGIHEIPRFPAWIDRRPQTSWTCRRPHDVLGSEPSRGGPAQSAPPAVGRRSVVGRATRRGST